MTQANSGRSDEEIFNELRAKLMTLPESEQRNSSLQMIESLGPQGVAAMVRMKEMQNQAKAARPTLQDAVFGKLAADDDSWEGIAEDPRAKRVFGSANKILLQVIRRDQESPSESQRVAFQALLAASESVAAAIAQANFDYYVSVKQRYRDAAEEDEWDEFLPDVAAVEDVERLLSKPTICIPPQDGNARCVVVTWECSWDPEHGHQVELRDETVEYAGMQR
jgi:hypothetical protein